MAKIKTYVATVKITFDTLESENPRAIAKNMANACNCMRGLNLYSYGALKKLAEKIEPQNKTAKRLDV